MRFFLLLLCCYSALFAIDYEPWFPPPWEFQSRIGYLYSHTERVQSPAGSFKHLDNYHNFFGSLAMTAWPDIHIEAELGFVKSDEIPFSYEVFALAGRKMWLDDLCGDCVSLTTGVTLAFPSTRILHNFDYPYHGYANGELHLVIGKEFRDPCTMEWAWRLWGLIGWGVAERGSPWVHGIVTYDQALSSCSYFTLYIETLNGLGGNDIIESKTFRGYGSINHKTIDIGGSYNYHFRSHAMLTLLGYINVHAINFTEHTFGLEAKLLIPFGL